VKRLICRCKGRVRRERARCRGAQIWTCWNMLESNDWKLRQIEGDD